MTRRAICYLFIFIYGLLILAPSAVFAAGEVLISGKALEQDPPDHYYVLGTVTNVTSEPREVILRAQVLFHDKAVPKGDLPVMVLRKDVTMILKAKEQKSLRIPILKEGFLPRLDLRVEPELRLRRQRVWNY